MLLAIDTATRVASVALYAQDGLHAELTWRSRENHTVELMPAIVRLMELGRAAKTDLTGIGVAMGPGSFTGLRVGMSVGKGLAFALHLPLMGIPTLDSVAQAHVSQSLPVWAVVSAGRGRYSAARYATRDGTISRAGDYALVNGAGLVELAVKDDSMSEKQRERMLFSGEIDAPLAGLIAERLGKRAQIDTPAMNARRAGFLAELAWERLQRGDSDNVESLAPMYAPHETKAIDQKQL